MHGMKNHKVQKPENLKKALVDLAVYCKNQAGFIIAALLLAAVGAVLTIAGPDQISKITDYMYEGLKGEIKMEGIAKVAVFLLSIYLISGICTF